MSESYISSAFLAQPKGTGQDAHGILWHIYHAELSQADAQMLHYYSASQGPRVKIMAGSKAERFESFHKLPWYYTSKTTLS